MKVTLVTILFLLLTVAHTVESKKGKKGKKKATKKAKKAEKATASDVKATETPPTTARVEVKTQDVVDVQPAVDAQQEDDTCKEGWRPFGKDSDVNCVGGAFCHEPRPDLCTLDCNEPSSHGAPCDPNDTKCRMAELVHCTCNPPSCCATFGCHRNLRGGGQLL